MWIRLVTGFLVAPAVPLALGAVYSALAGVNALGAAAMFVVYAYPIALVIGIPAFLWFRRNGWLQWWQVTAAGAAIGAMLPLSLTIVWVSRDGFDPGAVVFVMDGVVLGALCAFVFWLVGLRIAGKTRATG